MASGMPVGSLQLPAPAPPGKKGMPGRDVLDCSQPGGGPVSRNWSARDVHPMELDKVRFHHVARHLYQPTEHWEQVIPGLGDARGRAWTAGCAPAILDARWPDCERALPACQTHVLQDHDTLLAPAYLKEVVSADQVGQVGALPEKKGQGPGWAFVGDTGVMVIVREVGPSRRPEVKTAYRIEPKRREARGPDDFLKAALRKLRDTTSWKGG